MFIDRCRLVVQPTDDLRAAQGAIACADATFQSRVPRMRVTAGSGVGAEWVDPDAGAALRGIAVAVTPCSGALDEGAIATAKQPVRRFRRLTDSDRSGRGTERGRVAVGDLVIATPWVVGDGRTGQHAGTLSRVGYAAAGGAA